MDKVDRPTLIRIYVAFLISAIILIVLMIVPLPGNDVSYFTDPNQQFGIKQTISVITTILSIVWFMKMESKLRVEVLIGSVLFGPLMALTIINSYILLKLFPPKVEEQ